jgi:glycosidase
VGPGLLDSATNYQLSKALWSSLNDGNYFELAHCLQRSRAEYAGLGPLLEFIGNHDVTRLASRLACPEHLELGTAALLLAVGGMPCLYYGDELGMQGLSTKDGGSGCDADVRLPMPHPTLPGSDGTDRASRLFHAVSEMLRVRRSNAALTGNGSAEVSVVSNGQLAVARRSGSSVAMVLFNCEADAADGGFPSWANFSETGIPTGTTLTRVLAFSEGRPVSSGAEDTVEVLEGGRLRVSSPTGLPSRSVGVYTANL